MPRLQTDYSVPGASMLMRAPLDDGDADRQLVGAAQLAMNDEYEPGHPKLPPLHPPLQIDPNAESMHAGGPGAIEKAVMQIKGEQGGIGTVFIGDVAKRLGLPPKVLHEVLPELAAQGKVNLHASSKAEGNMTPEQREGGFMIGNRKVHMITLPRGQE